eukprot:1881476-Amphidinium_carterae.1
MSERQIPLLAAFEECESAKFAAFEECQSAKFLYLQQLRNVRAANAFTCQMPCFAGLPNAVFCSVVGGAWGSQMPCSAVFWRPECFGGLGSVLPCFGKLK